MPLSTYVAASLVVFTAINFFIAAQDDGFDFDKFKCKSGLLYAINRCFICMCANSSLFPCTTMECEGPGFIEAKNCNGGKKWKEVCNDCECVVGLGTVCTTKECPKPKPLDLDADYDYPLEVEPNDDLIIFNTTPDDSIYDTNSLEIGNYR